MNDRVGKVYLVGAGPGDPSLITVRGVECLRRADVVIYDHLANPDLLRYAPPDAERLYVGKRGGAHTVPQEEIGTLMVRRAQEGKVVVRLKGGDPYLFGRGGEEAEALAAAGLPFEMVPGVTSAFSVPAYAGIPVTHRAYSSSVAVVTGHEDPTKTASSIRWDKLATAVDTLVFLMGVGNLPFIVERLIESGRDPATPAAAISWGTTPRQRTVVGELASIARRVREEGIKPPAVLVVGEVVRLRESIEWFERRPLFGRRIVVTRAREQAGKFSSLLREHGAEVTEVPTIRIVPPESWAEVDRAIEELASYRWIIFTSVNGVAAFMNRLRERGRDVRDLKGIRACAIGPATAEELERFGIVPDLVPTDYRAEGLAEALRGEEVRGARVLLPRAERARDVLPSVLEERGAELTVAPVYRTVTPDEDVETLRGIFRERSVDMITFTSSSTVTGFAEIFSGEPPAGVLEGVAVACIGPITAQTAEELGMTVHVQPESYTVPALAEAIVRHYTSL